MVQENVTERMRKEPFKEEFTVNTENLVHVLGIDLFKSSLRCCRQGKILL